MKSIEQRAYDCFAGESCPRDCENCEARTECTDVDYVWAFIAGAKSEHEELTRWNSPECKPKVNTPILLKMEGPRKDIIYRTGYFIVDYVANDRTVYLYKVIGWREIYE